MNLSDLVPEQKKDWNNRLSLTKQLTLHFDGGADGVLKNIADSNQLMNVDPNTAKVLQKEINSSD